MTSWMMIIYIYIYIYITSWMMIIYIYIYIYILTWTAFPYHTLHRQPIPITGIARLYAVLCRSVGRLAIVPPNSLRCDCVMYSPMRTCVTPILFSSAQNIGTFEES